MSFMWWTKGEQREYRLKCFRDEGGGRGWVIQLIFTLKSQREVRTPVSLGVHGVRFYACALEEKGYLKVSSISCDPSVDILGCKYLVAKSIPDSLFCIVMCKSISWSSAFNKLISFSSACLSALGEVSGNRGLTSAKCWRMHWQVSFLTNTGGGGPWGWAGYGSKGRPSWVFLV